MLKFQTCISYFIVKLTHIIYLYISTSIEPKGKNIFSDLFSVKLKIISKKIRVNLMHLHHLLSRCQMFLLPLLPPIVLNIYTECLDPCCQPMVPTLPWSPCSSMAFMPNHWPLPNSLDFVVFRYVCEHIFVLILHAWHFGGPKS